MILRGMSGASTGASSGACLGYYLGHVWGMSKACLEHVWDMSGASSGASSGACLGHGLVWGMPSHSTTMAMAIRAPSELRDVNHALIGSSSK